MTPTSSELVPCGIFESSWIVFGSLSRPLGKEHAEISVVCQIEAVDKVTISQLHQAWQELGAEYPNLRAIPVDFKKCHVDVETWSQTTFTVDTDTSAAALMRRVPPRDLPGLWWLPSSQEVVFISQHWRVDGVGALMLMDRFFEILAQGPNVQSKCPDTLSLVLEDAADSDGLDNPSVQSFGVEKAVSFHDVMFIHGNLPFEGDLSTLPGVIGQYGIILSESTTSEVVRRCKSNDITVTAAANFALAQMIFATSTAGDVDKECRTMISADPRPHLPTPHNSRQSACNVYVLGSVGVVPRGSTFSDATRATTHELKNWFTEDFRRSIRWFLASVSTSPPPTPPSGVYLSNLGVVEQHLKHEYGNFKVKAFHLGTATMTRQMTFHVWTFRGRMVLSLNYNRSYHTLASVQNRLSIIRDELGKGLGLEIEADEAMVI